MPKTVFKMRHFKHFKRWPRLSDDVSKLDSLVHYIMQHAIENGNNPRWGLMADKFAARAEVDRILGPGHLVPLLGHWDNPEDIDFDTLPKSFILKTNNGCGTNIFVHDKDKADRQDIVNKLKKALSFPYPELTGQLHYSLIPPMVIAERIMVQDGNHKSLTDYKIHCVNGIPRILYVYTDRDEVNHFNYNIKPYTPHWQLIPEWKTPDDVADHPVAPDKPQWLDEMMEFARRLSAGEEYVRVDFYHTGGKILFGEMTYTPDTAYNNCFIPYQPAMKYLLNKIVEERNS